MSKDFKTYQLGGLYPVHEGASHLLLGCRRDDYSASRIARAVEDCDAHLLNLNMMKDGDNAYDFLVDIRVNRLSGEAVARSLERYGYDVLDFTPGDTSDAEDSTLRRRVEELLRYLNV